MENKKLLVLGAGQYGHVVRETAEAMGCFANVDFLDDNNPIAVGKLADYNRLKASYDCMFVAIGNPAVRMQWLNTLEHDQVELAVLIHPKAYVSPTAVLGGGTIVEAMSVVNTEAVIGKGGLLCAGCVVNHNAVVQACCQVDCNAVIAAGAVVPEGAKVFAGTVFERK